MTKRIDKGYGSRRIALNMGDLCVQNQKLITTAVDRILDSDKQDIPTLKALNQLSLNNMEAFAVHGRIADGKLAEAELISERAVAERKTGS